MKKVKILSYGINYIGDSKGINPGIHAEVDALNKLNNIKSKNKLQNINLIVIRLSKKNKLQSSKPCINCLNTLNHLPKKKGYRIKNIYYSNHDDTIIKTTITDLLNENCHVSSFFRRLR